MQLLLLLMHAVLMHAVFRHIVHKGLMGVHSLALLLASSICMFASRRQDHENQRRVHAHPKRGQARCIRTPATGHNLAVIKLTDSHTRRSNKPHSHLSSGCFAFYVGTQLRYDCAGSVRFWGRRPRCGHGGLSEDRDLFAIVVELLFRYKANR